MHCWKILATGLVLVLGALTNVSALAGVYGDDMAKCLVRSTTEVDRTVFVRWMFAAMALHPDVESMAVISAEQRDAINRDAGALFQRLLTESCRSETQQAIKYEGAPTIQAAFTVFGQVAGRELMLNPHVSQSMAGLAKYLDQAKLRELVPESSTK
jgi:hypothetical protein